MVFERLGAWVARHWPSVTLGWLLIAIALHLIAPRWNDVTHDGDLAYLPDDLPSVAGQRLLVRAFPDHKAKSQIGIVVERSDGPLDPTDLAWSDSLAELFRERQDELPIADVWNRNSEIVGDKLTSRVSKRGQATLTLLQLSNEFMAVGNIAMLTEVNRTLDEARQQAPAGLTLGVTGSAAIGANMLSSAAQSIRNTEWATVALVVGILLVVYRAPLLVVVPLVTIGAALFISLDLLALLTQVGRLEGFAWWNFKVFTTTKVFIVVILFGAGTDFCLFLISRVKEELEQGASRSAAVAHAVGRVGEALVGSAMTTICGLAMMYFADFGKFSNSGPAIALCLAVTLLASLTLAPALLCAFGSAVYWPWGLRNLRTAATIGNASSELDPDGRFAGFWQWLASVIVRYPGTILAASLVLLTPAAYWGSSVRLTYDLINELDRSQESVVGAQLAERHFAAGDMAPVTVLALKEGAQFDSADMEREIARLTKRLYSVDGVEIVRSVAEPTGDPPGYLQPFRTSGLKKLAARKHKTTRAQFVTEVPGLEGNVARFDVVFNAEPFSPAAGAMLNRLDQYLTRLSRDRSSAWHGAEFVFAGTTSGIRDLAAVTQSDQTLIQRLVLLAVLSVLLVIVRKPWICLYLIASVLFTYYVTIGTTQLFFAWWYGDTYQGLDWKVPIFLFVILIAVGEDYNIYLVTRVFEEQRRLGPLAGLERAVARTGGIITSCGLIMAGTFLSMMAGTLRGMLELGFALALGVMLDTCIVRPILVPAFLAILERRRQPAPPDGAESVDLADAPRDHWSPAQV